MFVMGPNGPESTTSVMCTSASDTLREQANASRSCPPMEPTASVEARTPGIRSFSMMTSGCGGVMDADGVLDIVMSVALAEEDTDDDADNDGVCDGATECDRDCVEERVIVADCEAIDGVWRVCVCVGV